jgi:hypothetical protein
MLLSPLPLEQALAEAEAGDSRSVGAIQCGSAFAGCRVPRTRRTRSGTTHRLRCADPDRLRALLLCYENDASPAIAAARSALMGASAR